MSAPSGARLDLRLTAFAAAVLAATGAWADERDDEIKKQTRPDSNIEVGVGFVDDANTRFGQYNGMVKDRLYLLLDGDYVRRDDATGTWIGIRGRNLGQENRELRFEQSRQGDWGYFVDFSQTPRYSPYTPITGLTGYDSTSQTVNGQAPNPLELKTERRALAAGVEKWVAQRWDVRFTARQEQKDGRRLFGSGGGTAFLVDPIDYRTSLYEATVGYTGDKAQFTFGYYGTNFVNYKTRLDVAGSPSGVTPIGLPPGNQSHQINFAGGYSFTPTTRATYKLAYTHQTQDDSFIDVSTTGRTNLGGVVDTKFGQVGLTARPMPKLALVADLRKENRDDKTPIVDYFNVATTNTATGENEPRSIHALVGKLEGTYQLPARFRVTGGFDYDERKRNTSPVRVVSFREKTEERTLRLDLRRDMSETLNGSIGYAHSKRDGSEWQTTVTTTPGQLGSNLVHPLHLADRERDKLRATLGWTPLDKLDLQARAESSKDEYGGRTLGLQDGSARFFSLDGAYRFGESWNLTAWVSRDDTKANLLSCMSAASNNNGDISACPNSAASPIWSANMRNVGNAFGLGVKGKATAQLEVGAELQIHNDRAEFRNGPTPTATPALTPPPDVSYNRQILRMTAKYAMQKNAGVRVQYVRDRFSTNDWTWENWTYSDGTQVLANPQQTVNFLSATYYVNF
ncbi:MAG TPA: MtrB/PioB family decaheme-associated outer membrane protein [Burkholderiales bacterium]|nr:MtrB/PioB family decaheme-associated outer membrane protein [Burkholderiales bacterium]